MGPAPWGLPREGRANTAWESVTDDRPKSWPGADLRYWGWTDTRFAQRGAVLSLAGGTRPSIADVAPVESDGTLDLLKAAVAVRRLGIPGGFSASVWSDVPPGSGAGSSAAACGGTVTSLARPGREMPLRKALGDLADCRVLPCQISHEGVRSRVTGT